MFLLTSPFARINGDAVEDMPDSTIGNPGVERAAVTISRATSPLLRVTGPKPARQKRSSVTSELSQRALPILQARKQYVAGPYAEPMRGVTAVRGVSEEAR